MLIQRYVFLLAAVLLSVSATALVNGQQETKRAAVFTPEAENIGFARHCRRIVAAAMRKLH